MSVARFAALLFIIMTNVVAAAPTPADLGKEVARAMPETPPGFTPVQADKKPSVAVDGHKGYRIVLRQESEEFSPTRQQAPSPDEPVQTITPSIIKWSHIDLVLIPDTDRVTSGLKNRIKWQDLAQEYFVKPVYMGKGHGFHWFGKTTIFWQDEVRRKMKLTGGDDRVALALEGMEIEEEGSMTRNSMPGIFRYLGDAAIPALQKVIKAHEKDEPYRYVSMLGCIETDKSTAALRTLYRSKVPEVSRAAAYVLATYSVRPGARREYLDMLRRGIRVAHVAAICAKYGWTEAIPSLEVVMVSPQTWWDFESAYMAHRRLTGRPVSEEITGAVVGFIRTDKEAEDARSALLEADDREAVAVIVIGRYDRGGKISNRDMEMHNRTVLEILGKLPIEIVRPLVETAARCTDEYDKKRFTKLLGEL